MASRRKATHGEDQSEVDDVNVTADAQANHERLLHDSNPEHPRFDEETGAPIDRGGLPRAMEPGEFPPDDVERALWIVGKGGTTARGKVYVEGEAILLSDLEAEQILDRGDKVSHSDPVAGKAHAETHAERQAARRAKRAEEHEAAAAEQAQA